MRKKITLETCRRNLLKRSCEYEEAALKERAKARAVRENGLEHLCETYIRNANRYEGIATASRWAAEDLLKVRGRDMKRDDRLTPGEMQRYLARESKGR